MSLRFDDFELDLDRFELRQSGESIALEPQAFDVLAYLATHRDRVASKEELFESVWESQFISDSALTTRIKEVRRALGDDGRTQRYVRTVRGRGYHFVGEVRDGAAPATAEVADRPVPSSASLSPTNEPRSIPAGRQAPAGFVGRRTELDRLQAAADAALAGNGSIALLAGEPGIGKTSTARMIEEYASTRGALVLWGWARESSGAPPYHPWTQIGEEYGRASDLASLVSEIGRSAVHLGGLIPSLAGGTATAEPEPVVDARAAQFRMFEAFVAFLRAASRRRPLMLVLDDLQWADAPTLALLQHVGPELESLPLLVLGTYRDMELDSRHPLSTALAQLNRERGFVRITLNGLSEVEVREYAQEHVKTPVERSLLQRVHARTEGNPFFLSQLLELLNDDQITDGGAPPQPTIGQEAETVPLPAGIREALAVRLERLSADARALLQVAAVIGRQFELAPLHSLLNHDDDQLIELIEEALDARLIEDFEQPCRYRFVHALMQETLLDETSAARRSRTHGQIAVALEAIFGDDATAEAPLLAYHFAESAKIDRQHAEPTVRYSLIAAGQAELQSAWDEAARLYERSLSFADEAGDDDVDLAIARLALGRCYHYAGTPRAAWRNLLTALEQFSEHGEWELAAEAVGLVAEVLAPPNRQVALISSVLDQGGNQVSQAKRATLLTKRSMLRVAGGESPEETEDDADAAATLLGEVELPGVEALLLRREAGKARRLPQGASVFELFTRAAEQFERAGNLDEVCEARWGAANELLRVGPVDAIDEHLEELNEYAGRRRLGRWAHLSRYAMARLAVLRARPEDARQLIDEMELAGQVSGYPRVARAALAELGEWPPDLSTLLPALSTAGGEAFQLMAVHASRLRTFVLDGQLDAARGEWDQARGLVTDHGNQPGGIYPTGMYATMGDALTAVVAPEELEPVYEYLTQGPTVIAGYAGNMSNVRGRLALRLQRFDAAERQLETALEETEHAGWPVDQGRVHQALAELAQTRGDSARAARHLDEAASRFRRHGAQVFLRQLEATSEA